jgi:hypothetical protein
MFRTDGGSESMPWRKFIVKQPSQDHYRKLMDDIVAVWSDIDCSFTSEDANTGSPERTREAAAMNELPEFIEEAEQVEAPQPMEQVEVPQPMEQVKQEQVEVPQLIEEVEVPQFIEEVKQEEVKEVKKVKKSEEEEVKEGAPAVFMLSRPMRTVPIPKLSDLVAQGIIPEDMIPQGMLPPDLSCIICYKPEPVEDRGTTSCCNKPVHHKCFSKQIHYITEMKEGAWRDG